MGSQTQFIDRIKKLLQAKILKPKVTKAKAVAVAKPEPTDLNPVIEPRDEVIDPETEKAVLEAYEKAVIKLILGDQAQMKFFATLVMRLQYGCATWIPTAATNGRWIWMNPKFWLGLSPEERMGVLAHEVMHIIEKHATRQQGREHHKFNIAADLEINHVLLEAGLTLPNDACVPAKGPFSNLKEGEICETYYNQLPESRKIKIMINADGSVSGLDPGGCGVFMDPASTEAERTQIAAEWDVAVRQAAQVAKEAQDRQRGTMPSYFNKLIEKLLTPPKIPWTAELREFFTVQARNDYSWSYPNRRHVANGLYLPSLLSQELGDIVFMVDLSGSMMGGDDLARCGVEMTAILENYPSKVYICYHDTQVHSVQEWDRHDGPIEFKGVGGGGTDHVPCFEWVKDKDLNPCVMICFTDLQTRFPEEVPPYAVFWVTVAGGKAPFGRVLEI